MPIEHEEKESQTQTTTDGGGKASSIPESRLAEVVAERNQLRERLNELESNELVEIAVKCGEIGLTSDDLVGLVQQKFFGSTEEKREATQTLDKAGVTGNDLAALRKELLNDPEIQELRANQAMLAQALESRDVQDAVSKIESTYGLKRGTDEYEMFGEYLIAHEKATWDDAFAAVQRRMGKSKTGDQEARNKEKRQRSATERPNSSTADNNAPDDVDTKQSFERLAEVAGKRFGQGRS